MSDHKKHMDIEKRIIGQVFPIVHKVMDNPRFILGAKHRILLHDLNTVFFFTSLFGREYGLSCLLHILEDERSRRRRKDKW